MGFGRRGKGCKLREILGVKLEERGGFEGGFMVGVEGFGIWGFRVLGLGGGIVGIGDERD